MNSRMKNTDHTKTVLVTGALGFIGRSVCKILANDFFVVGVDQIQDAGQTPGFIYENGNVADTLCVESIVQKYHPDVVVHCAGIAHQKLNTSISYKDYQRVNVDSVKIVAEKAAEVNPEVHFIFLSSISVYGERDLKIPVKERAPTMPTSQYADSKVRAELGLKHLHDNDVIKKVEILRLAPVYDEKRTLNLDKRIFGPQKMFYLKFGSGNQEMSILHKENLSRYIACIIKVSNIDSFFRITNVCDLKPCSFNELMNVFKKSKYQPNTITVSFPLWGVKLITEILALIIKDKASLIKSFYDKLANSLVFDNKRMLDTGFKPVHTLKTIYKK